MNDLIDLPDLGDNTPEFSVSEISMGIKKLIETKFDYIRVKGELGRVSRPASGHIYLDLKDERAVIAGVLWKGTALKLSVLPEEGMEVVVKGRLTTFPGQSKYQIIIDDLALAGSGALMAMLEKRKKELGAEGIFDAHNKKQLPYLPNHIGVITSPTGAVIKDIMHRLSDRFPSRVTIWPVVVQGEKCAPDVSKAIAGFNQLGDRPDVIIIARGGGSLEDLWGFNEEIVVRAVFASSIPIISAIGHETDTTLIDFVADVRAPTPSAAAEMVVPVKHELLQSLSSVTSRLQRLSNLILQNKKQRIVDMSRGLPKGEDLFFSQGQKLDFLIDRLPNALKGLTQKFRLKVISTTASINFKVLEQSIHLKRTQLGSLEKRFQRTILNNFENLNQKLHSVERLRQNLGYRETLRRGYVVLRDNDGLLTTAQKALLSKSSITAEFFDGTLSLSGQETKKSK